MTTVIKKDKLLFKSVQYTCDSISTFMNQFPSQRCRTNKMIWLSESKLRAQSYGQNLKMFRAASDIDLWDFIESPYQFNLESGYIDDEFKGKFQSVLRLLGEGQDLNFQAGMLYGLLSGVNFTVGTQLSILKSIYALVNDNSDLVFNEQALAQLSMTPDYKDMQTVLKEYIDLADDFTESNLRMKNQRLSIYGFDQILLKLMCVNEEVGNQTGISGWYIPQDTKSVWTEVVSGYIVSDMGELAIFDSRKLINCASERASLKKNKSKKSRKSKKFKKSRKSKKSKKSRKSKKFKKSKKSKGAKKSKTSKRR